MKRAAALVSAIALLLLAAPALSLGPFHPKPVEFQLSPGVEAVEQEASDEVLSKPLRSPKRFNVVGLTWEGDAEPEIRLRVREAGNGWGPWTDVPAHPDGAPDPGGPERSTEGVSSPVWAGEADYVQYRLSKRVENLRLKFVNASGTATAADRAKTGVIGAVTGASQAVTGLLTAKADPQPTINPRSSWGASNCPPRRTPDYGEVKASFVHHTVNANDYTSSQVPSMILSICRYHRNTNGWDDIAYQFLVDKYGRLWEGRAGGIDKAVVGAQAQGYNAQSMGVANLGTNTSVKATSASLDAMAKLIRWKLPLHGQPTEGTVTLTSAGGELNRYPAGTLVKVNRIPGHRDGDKTTCPGDALYAQLPDLRRRADRPPAAPRGLTATTNSSGIALDWADNSEPDLSGYEVYRSSTAGGPYSKINASRIGRSSYTDSSVSANTPYYYVVKAADKINQLSPASNEGAATSGTAPPYRDVVLNTSSLVSYWRLSESAGTTATDSKGAKHGSYMNSPQLGAEGALLTDANKAVTFDGTDDSVGTPRPIQDDFSIEFWFRSTQGIGTTNTQWWGGAGLVDGEVTGAVNDFGTSLDASGRVWAGTGNPDVSVKSGTGFNDGAWHHVVFTRVRSTGALALYVDGKAVASGKGGAQSLTSPPGLRMAAVQTARRWFRGSLDEVAVYNTALSATAVAQHYAAR